MPKFYSLSHASTQLSQHSHCVSHQLGDSDQCPYIRHILCIETVMRFQKFKSQDMFNMSND